MSTDTRTAVRLGLPKGRMQDNILDLFRAAGVGLRLGRRGYRPALPLDGFEAKMLKPQNIVEMLQEGRRDLGFAGADWVEEKGADLVELLDTGLDPVRIVLAGFPSALEGGRLPKRHYLIATEYVGLTRAYVAREGIEATVVRSYGATEVFPPEDADLIVDNTATGETLQANGLLILDEVMRSSTRLYANPKALEHEAKRRRIEDLVMLLRSVVDARGRVMVEVNVSDADLTAVTDALPAMKRPTISRLYGDEGYVVKASMPKSQLPTVIPAIKAAGGTDIVVSDVAQLVY